jgi:hypothetical protein
VRQSGIQELDMTGQDDLRVRRAADHDVFRLESGDRDLDAGDAGVERGGRHGRLCLRLTTEIDPGRLGAGRHHRQQPKHDQGCPQDPLVHHFLPMGATRRRTVT